ncbi:MAG: amidohydrolase family protein, partial [Nitrospinota bacterium]
MIYRAAFILPGAEDPIRDGALRVSGGRVEEVAPVASLSAHHPQEEVVDLGQAVIMPGLVNAHCHLGLTELRPAARDFIPWLEEVVQELRTWQRERFERSVGAGLALSLASGTTSLGDISSRCSSAGALRGAGLRGVAFREVLGLAPEREEEALASVMAEMEGGRQPGPRLRLGISPHAPFSTSGELYRRSLALALRFSLPLATHVAESEEEVELLTRGKGPLVELLRRLGSPVECFNAPGLRPLEWLKELGLLQYPSLLVHANYLSVGELGLIANSPASICFCPRSHAFFGRKGHPWQELLAAGVNLCLGTDSLASNGGLGILDELRFLREEAP